MPRSPLPIDERDDAKHSSAAHRAGRSFFTVLALCLIAVGGVAASTFSDAFKTPVAEETPATTVTTAMHTTGVPAAAPTNTPTTTVTTAVPTTTAAPPLVARPLSGKVLTPYSEQPLFNKTMADYRAHLALDLDGEEGQSVMAVAAGTVTDTVDDPLWGPTVTVDHGADVKTVYCGVKSGVPIGSQLEAGHELGKLAAVPCEAHLGPHLHLELYHNGKAADPATLLGELLPPSDK